jgi:hypothetical protein
MFLCVLLKIADRFSNLSALYVNDTEYSFILSVIYLKICTPETSPGSSVKKECYFLTSSFTCVRSTVGFIYLENVKRLSVHVC